MPIYAFECTACDHHFERLQRLSDADPSVCPECSAEAIRRQLTAPQFRLAGGGWYETDFKKDGDKKRNLAGDGGESKPAEPKSGESKSGESKPSEKSAEAKPTENKPASKPSETRAEPAKKAESKPSAGSSS